MALTSGTFGLDPVSGYDHHLTFIILSAHFLLDLESLQKVSFHQHLWLWSFRHRSARGHVSKACRLELLSPPSFPSRTHGRPFLISTHFLKPFLKSSVPYGRTLELEGSPQMVPPCPLGKMEEGEAKTEVMYLSPGRWLSNGRSVTQARVSQRSLVLS